LFIINDALYGREKYIIETHIYADHISIAEKNLKSDLGDSNPVDLEAGANRFAIS
jgi:hypothetical protein